MESNRSCWTDVKTLNIDKKNTYVTEEENNGLEKPSECYVHQIVDEHNVLLFYVCNYK